MRVKHALVLLLLCAAILGVGIEALLASSSRSRINQEECPPPGIMLENGTCYYPPGEEPPGEPPTGENPPPDNSWPGDARLNPDALEYYNVYCEYDHLLVRRGVPPAAEIARIHLWGLISGPFPIEVNGLTIERTDDVVTVSGSNGNGPAHPGSKSFTLSECLSRNGSLTSVPDTDGDGFTDDVDACPNVAGTNNGCPPAPPPDLVIDPLERANIMDVFIGCINLNGTFEGVTECIRTSLPSPLGSLLAITFEFLTALIDTLCGLPICFPALIAIPGSAYLRRRQRRKLKHQEL